MVSLLLTLNNFTPCSSVSIVNFEHVNAEWEAKLRNPNQVSYGTKSLRIQGPRVWNALPFYIKSKENLQAFKVEIKVWDGSKCSCNIRFDFSI